MTVKHIRESKDILDLLTCIYVIGVKPSRQDLRDSGKRIRLCA